MITDLFACDDCRAPEGPDWKFFFALSGFVFVLHGESLSCIMIWHYTFCWLGTCGLKIVQKKKNHLHVIGNFENNITSAVSQSLFNNSPASEGEEEEV